MAETLRCGDLGIVGHDGLAIGSVSFAFALFGPRFAITRRQFRVASLTVEDVQREKAHLGVVALMYLIVEGRLLL